MDTYEIKITNLGLNQHGIILLLKAEETIIEEINKMHQRLNFDISLQEMDGGIKAIVKAHEKIAPIHLSGIHKSVTRIADYIKEDYPFNTLYRARVREERGVR
jgi:hypothetical protein